jgi:AraC-like DNA-binding protein
MGGGRRVRGAGGGASGGARGSAGQDAATPARALSQTGRQTAAAPTLVLWGARALYVGPALGLGAHRSAVAVVAVGLGGPFGVARDPDPPPDEPHDGRDGAAALRWCRTAVIPPRTRHRLHATGVMAFVYLDALARDLAGVLERAGARDAPDGVLRAAYDLADEAAVVRLLADAANGVTPWPSSCARLAALLGLTPARAAGPACGGRRAPAPGRPRRLPAARRAGARRGLSPGRFARRFTAAAGVPFRRYRLWCRMAAVARAAAAGAPLTRAALDAGFASSAHLSAAFRAMFGSPPTRLALGRLTLVDLGDDHPADGPHG